jgi:parvulin-like peptidyl-prolyl isomerase
VTKTSRKSSLRAAVLVGIAVLGATGVLVAAGCGDDGENLPAGVVARVGDAPITEAQLDKTIEQSRAEATASGQALPKEGEDGYDDIRRQALQSLVQQKVVDFEARDCGKPCQVTKAEITAELARIRESNFENSQEKFDDFLEERKISKADANAIVKSQLQQQALFEHVTRGIRFTDAEARTYYDENAAQFKVPAGRTASHILVETEAEADRIRAEVTPENFAELAKENSTDTGSAQQGGSLGPIQKGQLVPEFEKVAFSLDDGQISQPVKTQFGWHIIMVDITPAKTTAFAEAKAQIIQSQLAQKRQTEFTEWSEKVLEDWADRTVYASGDLEPATTTAAATPTAPAP